MENLVIEALPGEQLGDMWADMPKDN